MTAAFSSPQKKRLTSSNQCLERCEAGVAEAFHGLRRLVGPLARHNSQAVFALERAEAMSDCRNPGGRRAISKSVLVEELSQWLFISSPETCRRMSNTAPHRRDTLSPSTQAAASSGNGTSRTV